MKNIETQPHALHRPIDTDSLVEHSGGSQRDRHVAASSGFRDDINLLRGISILLVTAFHFFPKALANGYLGVDIFFVISGYLITLGIFEARANGRFRFSDFYRRRVHRILPAATAMLLAITVLQLFILLPTDLVKYAHSLDATLLFFSNIHFFLTGGYFGGTDELKPLLHMWSLSIEEQFYIFFPAFFILATRFIKSGRSMALLLAALLVGSFCLNLFLFSINGRNAAFFILPTRIWQFMAGVLAAFVVFQRNHEYFQIPFLAPAGLALIALNALYIIPGLPDATLATIGVVLIALNPWSVPRNVFTRFLLFLGTISFSLYLWHWPIASLLNYVSIQHPDPFLAAAGAALSVLLSYLSWRYIEERFRKPRQTKTLLALLAASYAALLSTSFAIKYNDGLPNRYSPDVIEASSAVDSNFRCPKIGSILYGGSKACLVRQDAGSEAFDVAVFGNSHSLMYVPVIAEVLKGKNIFIVPANGCTPTLNLNLDALCRNIIAQNLSEISNDKRIRTVVIGTNWRHHRLQDNTGEEVVLQSGQFARDIMNTVEQLRQAGKQVFLIGPIATPQRDNNFASALSRSLALYGTAGSISQQVSSPDFSATYDADRRYLEQALGDYFIQPSRYLCDASYCYFRKDGKTLFADDNHLSRTGAMSTAEAFRVLERISR